MTDHPEEVHRVADGILALIKAVAPPTAELTTPQGFALRTIVHQGPLRVGELAAELTVTVATASRTVDALVAKKFVERTVDPSDARCVRVVATPLGVRHQRGVRERFRGRVAELLDGLSELERRQLADSVELLSRLFDRRESVSDRAQTG
jgi:DNA-binding MarR family transcriptional regulator